MNTLNLCVHKYMLVKAPLGIEKPTKQPVAPLWSSPEVSIGPQYLFIYARVPYCIHLFYPSRTN